jgi:hypothetical protein
MLDLVQKFKLFSMPSISDDETEQDVHHKIKARKIAAGQDY